MRRALNAAQQRYATQCVQNRCKKLKFWHRSQRIALYYATDGELSLNTLHLGRHHFFLPCLNPLKPGYLQFRPYQKKTAMKPNRFHIPEPARTFILNIWKLDLLIVPLVGFDLNGNRLGMGGGFYDRTLATLANRPHRPLIIGLAHDIQQIDSIQTEAWDYPLDAVLTPNRFLTRFG